jgi:predicted amidohydrolase
MVRIGFVQPRLEPKAVVHNIERCISLASTLDSPDLVVFPELANTAYGFENRDQLRCLAEEVPEGISTQRLRRASKVLDCVIVAGVAERDGPLLYNSAVILEAGKYVGKYRKTHLYGRENLFFEPGRDRARVYDLAKFRLAVQICLDLGFTGELARLSRLGAQVIAHPANLSIVHSGPPQTIKLAGNGAYIVSSNRVGDDKVYSEQTTFTGESMVLSPGLDILALASGDSEEALEVKAELEMKEEVRLAPRGGVS